jgi:hypothetical protein
MSKTKNTPEFEAMMRDQEMAASFDYQEKEALMEEIAVQHAIERATDEYIAAQKVFMEAQRKFSAALEVYRKYKGGLTEEEKEVSDSMSMLTNMFKGFNPNDI